MSREQERAAVRSTSQRNCKRGLLPRMNVGSDYTFHATFGDCVRWGTLDGCGRSWRSALDGMYGGNGIERHMAARLGSRMKR